MEDKDKAKESFADEIARLRQRIAELEESENQHERAMEQLRASEKKFLSIFNLAANLIILVNKEGIISNCSKRIEEVLGYTQEEIIGQSLDKIIHTYSLEEAQHCLQEISKKEYSYNKEYRMIRKDGRLIDVSVNSSGLRNEEGKYVETICIIDDITKRKQLENSLRESKEKLQKLFESVSDGIFVLDSNGVYTEVNERMLKMHGLRSKDEMLGKSSLTFVARKDLERARGSMQATLKQSATTYQEFSALKADGSEFPVEVSGAVIKNVSGNPTGFIGIIRDITDRKRAEEMLKESEQNYKSIIELAPDAIIIMDLKGRVSSCNDAFSNLTGFSRDEIINKHFSKLPGLPKKDILTYKKVFKSLLKGKMPETFESRWVNRDGTTRWGEVRIGSLKKEDKIIGFQIIGRDITDRKKGEKEQ